MRIPGSTSTTHRNYGVHDWTDNRGNHGTEIISQHQMKTCTVRMDNLFDLDHDRIEHGLTRYFCSNNALKRNVFVVFDKNLHQKTKVLMETYFRWCKTENLLQNYTIIAIESDEAKKTMEQVLEVVAAAKTAELKRRDLFIAIGPSALSDIVGFAAGTYRRSAPWISVPTSLSGMIQGFDYARSLNIDHKSPDGTTHKDVLALHHPPNANFYDPKLLKSLEKDDIETGLVDLIRLSLHSNSDILKYIDGHLEEILSGIHTSYLVGAVELAATTIMERQTDAERNQDTLTLEREVLDAIRKAENPSWGHADAKTIAIGLTSALGFLLGHLDGADLERILNTFERIGRPTYDQSLDAVELSSYLTGRASNHSMSVVVFGKESRVDATEMTLKTLGAALSLLRKRHTTSPQKTSTSGTKVCAVIDINKVDNVFQKDEKERVVSQDMQYHVATVPRIFDADNTTLVESYCVSQVDQHKRKVLVVVDINIGGKVADVERYFNAHSSAFEGVRILPMHVTSAGKDVGCVTTVLNDAIELGMSKRDIILAVGGGTLMDVVGFAAAIFRGGISYVRIATTLVGMIDAGVGAKVGVNFEHHKSLVGSYYPPIACLNDPETFLVGLPRREFACGLAEAAKMAMLKSSRLFDVIEQFHATGGINEHTNELIHISIQTMLEELQPNLLEHDLRRLVDFGHEFGHIVESNAKHEIPHGECVSIGMALSSTLANMKGIFSKTDLDRLLNCLLDLGLPIFATDYDCCDSDDLWNKIRTQGIEHKDGMLWLAIPKTIGEGGFLDHISDINSDMVREALISLKHFQARHGKVQFSRIGQVQGSSPAILENPSGGSIDGQTGSTNGFRSDSTSACNGQHAGGVSSQKPFVIVLDVGATYLRAGIVGPKGLLEEPLRIPTPSKQAYPEASPTMLQDRLLETIRYEVDLIRARYRDLPLEEVAVSFGAVVTREGVVVDASILWNDSARGYNFKDALGNSLPGMRLTVLNDISAAAWRYQDEGRYCLITVSSGLSNKVFNPDLNGIDKLDLDAAGVGGEMGHVLVEPRAVDAVVQAAMSEARARPTEFERSQLSSHVQGDVQKINARYLGLAAKNGDEFTLQLLDAADIPYCNCGNLADLCAYSSGRGALRYAQRLAAKGNHGLVPGSIDDSWLREAIRTGHPLALKVLHDSTYPLAMRILQLAADIGLDKFIIVGGFALKTGGKAYLRKLQDHLVHFCHYSAFFSTWDEAKVRGLVQFGVDDDNDGLLGVGGFVQHSRSHYRAIEKIVGGQSLKPVTRRIPSCGAQEVLAKVLYAGICTTDLQILRGERGHEPVVLGHEGVCQVVEVGKDVTGLEVGEMIVLNPNNPLDDYDKLGHTREGVFQEFIKFGDEFLKRDQVLKLGTAAVSATDTLVEPLSCVVAAQERIKDRIVGKNVLVVGAGMMGLLFVSMNVLMGAANVFLANRSKERLEFAVSRSIVSEEKTFVIDGDISSQVKQVTANEGVDIVIICVSIGHGEKAAQDAIAYINPGGCVYLFAGFRPGNVLTADGNVDIDAWGVRTGWKTERVHHLGKPLDISGHRGCRNQDLAAAAKYIHSDRLAFGKLISHIISLDALPDALAEVSRNGNVQGVPARRIVVDMTAQNKAVESVLEFPFRHLRNAAGKHRDTIPLGNIFREIGFDSSNSFLGWVHPPQWQAVRTAIESALRMNSLELKKDFIWVGTGAWTFLPDALRQIIPRAQDVRFHTLYSLEPYELVELFDSIGDLSSAVCIGVSQSGKTMETTLLMNTLRERFEDAGLDYRKHFLWLTDMSKSKQDINSGESYLRSSDKVDWRHVDMMPVSIGNHAELNALFSVPYSTMMLLPLALLLGRDFEALRRIYQCFLDSKEETVNGILLSAYSTATLGTEHIKISFDESIMPSAVPLATQLVEQTLGSKQANFSPRVLISDDTKINNSEDLTLKMPTEAPPAAKLMLTMNALSVFVAIVAYHRRIHFVTHPKVNLYKNRAMELLAASDIQPITPSTGTISSDISARLRISPQTRFVEVLYYGHLSRQDQQNLKEQLSDSIASVNDNVTLEVTRGEQWNHSRYQAAVHRKDTLFVVVGVHKSCAPVKGVSETTIQNNIRTLKAIARATYETLLPNALFFEGSDTL